MLGGISESQLCEKDILTLRQGETFSIQERGLGHTLSKSPW